MTDPVARSAARLAALIAVPVALLAGIGVFALLNNDPGGSSGADPSPSPSPTAPAATGPVQMPARELTERQQVVCRALLSQLPADLDGPAQRPVTAGPEQNAAYGDPPITVACGVPPVEVPPTAFLPGLSGVCWYAEEGPDATVWTTLDREVPVRVTVPAAYDAPAQQVVPISDTVLETVRSVPDAPSGCADG